MCLFMCVYLYCSPKRRELIEKAWQQIDINGEGVVTPEEVQ